MNAPRRIYPDVRAFVAENVLYKPNERGGKCLYCGQYVEPRKGCVVRKGPRNARRTTWHISHLPLSDGTCPALIERDGMVTQ